MTDFGDSAQNYCESRLDDEPPLTSTCRRRPPTRLAGRDFHLVAAFDFHRQIVLRNMIASMHRSRHNAASDIGEAVSPDVTPSKAPLRARGRLLDYAMMKQCC